jgi:hypothetical protein
MNPYLLSPHPETMEIKEVKAVNDDQLVQDAAKNAVRKSTTESLSVQFGRLLIKVGTRLTGGNPLQYKAKHIVS